MICFFNILFLFGVLVATTRSIAPSSVIQMYYIHFYKPNYLDSITEILIWPHFRAVAVLSIIQPRLKKKKKKHWHGFYVN